MIRSYFSSISNIIIVICFYARIIFFFFFSIFFGRCIYFTSVWAILSWFEISPFLFLSFFFVIIILNFIWSLICWEPISIFYFFFFASSLIYFSVLSLSYASFSSRDWFIYHSWHFIACLCLCNLCLCPISLICLGTHFVVVFFFVGLFILLRINSYGDRIEMEIQWIS